MVRNRLLRSVILFSHGYARLKFSTPPDVQKKIYHLNGSRVRMATIIRTLGLDALSHKARAAFLRMHYLSQVYQARAGLFIMDTPLQREQ